MLDDEDKGRADAVAETDCDGDGDGDGVNNDQDEDNGEPMAVVGRRSVAPVSPTVVRRLRRGITVVVRNVGALETM